MEFVKDSDYIAIRNLKQILATNEKVAKEIREGIITPSQGKAIISCSNANIKAIQLLDLEKRITQIITTDKTTNTVKKHDIYQKAFFQIDYA